MEKLITIDDIRTLRNLSKTYSQNKLDGYINEVQNNELQDLFGKSLFFDFATNLQNVIYQNLLNGTIYENLDANNVQFNGIKNFLIYNVLAKITIEGEIFFGEQGTVKFTAENGTQTFISSAKKNEVATNFLRLAQKEKNEIIDFLNQNSDIYSFWQTTKDDNSEFLFDII